MKKTTLICLLTAAFTAITSSVIAQTIDDESSLRKPKKPKPVPDGGVTLALLGTGVLAIEALRRKLSK